MLAGIDKSASLLVVRGNKLVHESYFHGAQPDSAKNIHSGSKSILSALTGIALSGLWLPYGGLFFFGYFGKKREARIQDPARCAEPLRPEFLRLCEAWKKKLLPDF